MEDGGKNYDFVWVDEMGITSAYAPKTTEGDHQTIVFVSSVCSLGLFYLILCLQNRGNNNCEGALGCQLVKYV